MLRTKSGIVVGLYRPPESLTGAYQQQLEDELNHICNWASLQGKMVVLLRDLNLDRLFPHKAEGKLLIDTEKTHGMECMITRPTRIQTSGGRITKTLIDVILTNQPDAFVNCGIYDPRLSEHPLIYGFMNEKVVRHGARIIKFRSIKNFDEQKFRQHLSTAPWHVGNIFDDIEDQTGFFTELLTDIVDEHMPAKQMRVRGKDVPYMTTEWKNAIRARRRATMRYRKTKAPEDWELQRKLGNETTRLGRNAIRDYWKTKVLELKQKPREFYKTFTPFLRSRKDQKHDMNVKLNINGRISTDQAEIVDVLGDYFATIANGIGGVNTNCNTICPENCNENTSVKIIKDSLQADCQLLKFQQLEVKEVEETLKEIKNVKQLAGTSYHQRL